MIPHCAINELIGTTYGSIHIDEYGDHSGSRLDEHVRAELVAPAANRLAADGHAALEQQCLDGLVGNGNASGPLS